MKHLMVITLAMAIFQSFAMYVFLRVLEIGFFVSAGLAALVAMLVSLGIYGVQSRAAAR